MVAAGHWHFTGGGPSLNGIPLSNTAGWALVALVIMVALVRLPERSPRLVDDRVPIVLFLWTYASSVLGAAAFFHRPGAALAGGVAMGIPVALLVRSRQLSAGPVREVLTVLTVAGPDAAWTLTVQSASNVRPARRPPQLPRGASTAERDSVLLALRDEAHRAGPCLAASAGQIAVPNVEFVVLDDDSSDATVELVASALGGDTRLRLIRGHGDPPPGSRQAMGLRPPRVGSGSALDRARVSRRRRGART